MTKTFKVLDSGSSGNCYILTIGDEQLIIEAGLPIRKILEGLNFNTSKVVGCLVSHSHLDHFKAASDMMNRFIPVYSNQEVVDLLGGGVVLPEKQLYSIGNFKVGALDVQHDVKCFAFVITHPDMGKMIFCTDAADFPYLIKNPDFVIMEANYDEDIMSQYLINNPNQFNNVNRLGKSHMCLGKSIDAIKRHNTEALQTVMLIHLSPTNSDESYFKTEVQKAIGKPVYIAKTKLSLNL